MTFTSYSLIDTLPTGWQSETVVSTAIDDIFALPVTPHHDERGFFAELGKIPHLDEVRGESFTIKQINHAHSKLHVTRGFHAEDWNKLITVTRGICFIAIADIREESETKGTVLVGLLGHQKAYDSLNASVKETLYDMPVFTGSIFLPRGVANSVCVLSDQLDYLYGVDKLYEERNPAGDIAISLFDPTINVSWPIDKKQMIISERDIQSVPYKTFIHSRA